MSATPLIAFSGLDGAGKSTQIALLEIRWRSLGHDVRVLWSRPGYTPGMNFLKLTLRRCLGRRIAPSGRNAQRSRAFANPLVRRVWLVLSLADLIVVYGVWVRVQRVRSRRVICDRYIVDALVDFKVNFPEDDVEAWWLWRLLASVAPQPDSHFLFLVSVEEAVKRSRSKAEPFPDAPPVLEKRLDAYRRLAAGGGFHVLDGQQSVSELQRRVFERAARAASVCRELRPDAVHPKT